MSTPKNVTFVRLISVIVLATLPLMFGWDILTSSLLIGQFIDFTVPENLQAAYNLVWSPTSTWNNAYNGGERNTFSATIMLQNLILYGPIYFFKSTWLLGKWSLFFPLSVSGVSYFIFFSYFLKFNRQALDVRSESSTAFEALLLSVIFTYTNFNFNELNYGSSNYVLSCALLPAAIALFHKGCLENRLSITVLISLILTCVAGGILQNLVILIIFFSIIVYNLRPSHTYIFKYILLFFLLSVYWILPVLLGVSDVLSNQLAVSYLPAVYSMYDILSNRVYVLGSRAHYQSAMPNLLEPIYPVVSGLFFLLPVYLIASNRVVQNRKFRFETLIFIWLLILALFFLKGQGAPFGELNKFVFENVSAASLFRTTNRFWPIFYLCLAFIYSSFVCFKFRIPILLIFTFVLCSGFFVNQDFGIAKRSMSQPSMPRVNLYEPNDRRSACLKFIHEDGDFKVLTKPMSGSVRFLNSTGSPTSQGLDAELYFSGKSYFNTDSLTGDDSFLTFLEYKMLTDNAFLIENSNLLRILGVKYFLIRKDVITEFSPNRAYSNTNADYAEHSKLFEKVYTDDYCTVYQFPEYFPTVYTVKTAAELNSIWDSTAYYSRRINDRLQQPVILKQNVWASEAVTYSKLSDSIYEFSMHGLSGSVPIFLNVNFSDDWTVIPDPSYLLGGWGRVYPYWESISAIKHFRGPVNNNGWIIDVPRVCKTTSVCEVNSDGLYSFRGLIIYRSQLLLAVGILIFCCVVLSFLLLLVTRRSLR